MGNAKTMTCPTQTEAIMVVVVASHHHHHHHHHHQSAGM